MRHRESGSVSGALYVCWVEKVDVVTPTFMDRVQAGNFPDVIGRLARMSWQKGTGTSYFEAYVLTLWQF